MVMSMEVEMRILLIFLLVSCIAEVSADQTRTALIASGCVAGGLLLAAVVIGGVYCFFRHKRRVEKKPLPRYKDGGPMANGVYRPERIPSRSTSGQFANFRDEPRSLGAKAFTQNAASPRQRPPVPFYTIRTDPRLPQEMPGLIHMGPTMYSRPPQVGRPVIFLDRNGTSKPKGSSSDFMYPNSGTMLYYANNGALIQTGKDNDERTRQVRRESRGDRKDRSRSQSRPRSLGAEMITRRHSDTYNTSVFGISREFSQKKIDDSSFLRTSKHNRRDDNNNPFALYFINNEKDKPATNFENHISKISGSDLIKNNDIYVSEGGRYSATQLSSNSMHPLVKTPHSSQIIFQERERTITFGSESDDLSSTPRKDYPGDSPGTSDISLMTRAEAAAESRSSVSANPITIDDPEETPRADYMSDTIASNQTSEHFQIKNGDMDDIIALSPQPANYITEHGGKTPTHRQSPNFFRAPSPPFATRPPTPPFDGVDVVRPSKLSISQRHEKISPTARVPTPPPDMSPDNKESALTSIGFQAPPPPPAPPLPVGKMKYQPPTPPPGLIKNDQEHNFGVAPSTSQQATSSEAASQKTPKETQGLPFIEELKRRQRSIDEGATVLPPSLVSPSVPPPGYLSHDGQQRGRLGGSVSSSSEETTSHRSESPKHGLPQRPSVVQFADDPPEIIPHEDNYNLHIYNDPESLKDLGMELALPPPPPPLPSTSR